MAKRKKKKMGAAAHVGTGVLAFLGGVGSSSAANGAVDMLTEDNVDPDKGMGHPAVRIGAGGATGAAAGGSVALSKNTRPLTLTAILSGLAGGLTPGTVRAIRKWLKKREVQGAGNVENTMAARKRLRHAPRGAGNVEDVIARRRNVAAAFGRN